jgi:hypothetical protein
MAKRKDLPQRDLLQLGWKALVAELGVANATRFIMRLRDGEQNYTQLRKALFEGKNLDELYAEMKRMERAYRRPRQR